MEQHNISLLLDVLCKSINTGLKISVNGVDYDLRGIDNNVSDESRRRVIAWHNGYPSSVVTFPVSDVRPYLRPVSSMTKDEREIYDCLSIGYNYNNDSKNILIPSPLTMDWLYGHHFDIHDLIKKGLAIELPETAYK